jgi:hypothetical protein
MQPARKLERGGAERLKHSPSTYEWSLAERLAIRRLARQTAPRLWRLLKDDAQRTNAKSLPTRIASSPTAIANELGISRAAAIRAFDALRQARLLRVIERPPQRGRRPGACRQQWMLELLDPIATENGLHTFSDDTQEALPLDDGNEESNCSDAAPVARSEAGPVAASEAVHGQRDPNCSVPVPLARVEKKESTTQVVNEKQLSTSPSAEPRSPTKESARDMRPSPRARYISSSSSSSSPGPKERASSPLAIGDVLGQSFDDLAAGVPAARQRETLRAHIIGHIPDPLLAPAVVDHVVEHACAGHEGLGVSLVEKWVSTAIRRPRTIPRRAFIGISKAEFVRRGLPWPFREGGILR